MEETKIEQYVYVMSNPSFPDNMFKIGWTRKYPTIRAKNLHTSGIPTPFIIEFLIITTDGYKLEKKIHEYIKQYRLNPNREFFKISKDILTKILTNELNLKLTLITEIITPIKNIIVDKKVIDNKDVNKINKLYEIVAKEMNEFINKLKKDKTELVINEINGKKYVTTIETECEQDCLYSHGFEDDNEKYIKDTIYFIQQDINQYKKWIDNLLNNYEDIKNEIGIEHLRDDNKLFKKMILNTHTKLNNIKSKYIWEL